MIVLHQVTKIYGKLIAVNHLSLSIDQGEVCVLIGPSGCGKTTTLRMINRLISPTSGQIYINGKDISALNPEKLRRSIGYAIQSVGLFPHMNVAANIAVVPELLNWNKGRIKERVQELLNLVGLDSQKHYYKYPYQLSGGEAQRVGVARALAADPPIMIMDEPFGAVDPLTREKLQLQFIRIQKQLHKTVILVTHDLDEAIRLADRIAIMKDGRLIQIDTPEVILSRPANKFVHDFVGTDRALKRLSRISVEPFIHYSSFINSDASIKEASSACEKCRWLWVVDSDKKLIGWIDKTMLSKKETIKEAMVAGDSEEIAINGNASLREALSRMLEQGFKTIPVVNENRQLIGEVDLATIEEATSETNN